MLVKLPYIPFFDCLGVDIATPLHSIALLVLHVSHQDML